VGENKATDCRCGCLALAQSAAQHSTGSDSDNIICAAQQDFRIATSFCVLSSCGSWFMEGAFTLFAGATGAVVQVRSGLDRCQPGCPVVKLQGRQKRGCLPAGDTQDAHMASS